ncbi:MAG: DUF523 domain-containing protein [Candidatus Omnitrophota bacterium]
MAKINNNYKKKKYIVSACLIGKSCFYDGTSRQDAAIKGLVDSGEAIALCPEELGGLKTPRPPSEIFAGSAEDVLKSKAFVFNKEGRDITINIIKGSREFLNMANAYEIKKAILKARSPCCGKGKVYDGTFTNRLKSGNGVTTALLLKNGIKVFSDEEFLGGIRSINKKASKSKVAKRNKGGKKKKTKRR